MLCFHLAGAGLLLVIRVGQQFVAGDRPIGDLGQFQHKVDHLVLEQGRAQLLAGGGILLVKFDHFTFLAREAPRLKGDGTIEFLIGNDDVVGAAGFREQQPQPHPAVGDDPIFILDLILGLVRLLEELFETCLRLGIGAGLFVVIVVPVVMTARAMVVLMVIERHAGQFLPDLGKLVFHHALGDIKGRQQGELVQEAALEAHPRDRCIFGGEPLLDRGFHDIKRFEPRRLGEIVVDLHRLGHLQLLHHDLELGFLAGQFLGRIIVGEGHLYGPRLARLGADHLLHESGNEALGVQCENEILGGAAGKFIAVDGAGEIHQQGIVDRGGPVLVGGLKGALLFRHARDRLVHHRIVHIDHQTFQLDGAEVRRCDIGHDFHRHGEFQVLAFVEFGDLNLRLHGRTQVLLAQGFLRGVGNGALQDLADDRRAILLAQQRYGHLAGTEPGHLDGGGDLREAGRNPSLDIVSRDGDGELAAQAFVLGLFDLHGILSQFSMFWSHCSCIYHRETRRGP